MGPGYPSTRVLTSLIQLDLKIFLVKSSYKQEKALKAVCYAGCVPVDNIAIRNITNTECAAIVVIHDPSVLHPPIQQPILHVFTFNAVNNKSSIVNVSKLKTH